MTRAAFICETPLATGVAADHARTAREAMPSLRTNRLPWQHAIRPHPICATRNGVMALIWPAAQGADPLFKPKGWALD